MKIIADIRHQGKNSCVIQYIEDTKDLYSIYIYGPKFSNSFQLRDFFGIMDRKQNGLQASMPYAVGQSGGNFLRSSCVIF